jgi:hypothetical protein
MSPAFAGSLRVDAGGPDHLGPFLGFVGDQLSELSRRSRHRHAAEVSETDLDYRWFVPDQSLQLLLAEWFKHIAMVTSPTSS